MFGDSQYEMRRQAQQLVFHMAALGGRLTLRVLIQCQKWFQFDGDELIVASCAVDNT